MNQTDNTEQTILKAAEGEFLEKGFARAKTTEIAKRAGVNHAMLHYYFRTKENLFNMIFEKKALLMVGSLSSILDSDLPFLEKIKKGIETHFDFLAENPQLPIFLINEILGNEKRRIFFLKMLHSKTFPLIEILERSILEESKKGTIKYVNPLHLLLNIVTLNSSSFLPQLFIQFVDKENRLPLESFLQERKEYSVRLVLNDLKI